MVYSTSLNNGDVEHGAMSISGSVTKYGARSKKIMTLKNNKTNKKSHNTYI